MNPANSMTTAQKQLERIYIKLIRRSDLQQLRKAFPPKKVFIMVDENTLFTELTPRELHLLLDTFDLSVRALESVVPTP